MLDSNDRRDAFDAFFASLDHASRVYFLAEASDQHATALEQEGRPSSIIDAMENVWDEWRELSRVRNPTDARAFVVDDPHRRARARAYYFDAEII